MASEEIPQPEADSTPEVQLFNVGAMTDEQVIVTARAYAELVYNADRKDDILNRPSEAEGAHQTQGFIGDTMAEIFAAQVRRQATIDPERFKSIIDRCANSPEIVDETFAAKTAIALVPSEFEFTRDTLIALSVSDKSGKIHEQQIHSGMDPPWEWAPDSLAVLIRDYPDQADDINARLAQAGYVGVRLEPDDPPTEG